MTDTTTWANATRRYTDAIIAARDYEDPTALPDDVARQRHRMKTEAQEKFRATIPPTPEPRGPRRAAVLDSLRPTTADAVAVQGREWAMVEALLGDDGGRVLPQVIERADASRLGAILDHIETWGPVLVSADGDAIIAELHDRIFDRLVAVGHDDAVRVADAERVDAPIAAWSRAMTEALEGDLSVDARTAVYRADLLGYDFALADLPLLGDAIRRIDVGAERLGMLTHP